MNSKMLVILFVLVLSSVSVFGQSKTPVVYSNVIETTGKLIKECLLYDEGNSEILSKTVYIYGKDGKTLHERTVYKWNERKGWMCVQKLNYQYNQDNQLISAVLSKWDRKINDWSDKREEVVYVSDGEGGLLAIRK